MGDPRLWRHVDRAQLRRDKREAARDLPAEWLPRIDAEARAVLPAWRGERGQSEVWRSWLDRYAGAAVSNMSDAEIKAHAAAHALAARNLDMGEFCDDPARELARIAQFCRDRDVEPPPFDEVKPQAARVRCPYWWRRALRRMIARRCESGALALGLVSKPAGSPYASNAAVWRRVDQNKRNADAALHIHFENDAGQVASLADLASRSTSNKSIRRGELMTRIRGCEEIADECGHVGVFLTLTCPSRFHSTLRDGRRNPKHDGSNPRDAQLWLRAMWHKALAKLGRKGIRAYGLRVAEPHHDGCTHWHALLWFADEASADAALQIIREYWLSDDGDERGADEYRVNFKRMERGGAAGYVAKYIAKNIDDHGLGGEHCDDYSDEVIRPDLLGDLEITPSLRVEAWAATWGIRQFQPIGQPPVGVWRELRRIPESEARRAGFNGAIHRAWLAAQRSGAVLADWARYVRAQGGMMQGRRAAIRVRTEVRELDGLYGRAERRCVLGVSLRHPLASVVWSARRLWMPVATSAEALERASDFRAAAAAQRAANAAPRTGVNNCTPPDEAEALRLDFLRGSGTGNTEKDPCEQPPSRPSRPPSPKSTPPTRKSAAAAAK